MAGTDILILLSLLSVVESPRRFLKYSNLGPTGIKSLEVGLK